AATAVAVGEERGLRRQPGEPQAHTHRYSHGGDHDAEAGSVRAENDAKDGRAQSCHHHEPWIAPRDEPARHGAESGRHEPDDGERRGDGGARGVIFGEERRGGEHGGGGKDREEEHGGGGGGEGRVRPALGRARDRGSICEPAEPAHLNPIRRTAWPKTPTG